MRYSLPLLIYLVVVLAPQPLTGQTTEPLPGASRSEESRPFTREEKSQLVARMTAVPRAAQRGAGQRRKVLSVTIPANTEALPQKKSRRRVAHVVVFDYTEGKATGLLVDASSAEVLAEEPIRGRPQASEEEKQDAIKIIRQNPELDKLLQANAIFEGGFIVDGPRGAPPAHRFLQLQLLSSDRAHLQRTVVVDLTAGAIAASKAGD